MLRAVHGRRSHLMAMASRGRLKRGCTLGARPKSVSYKIRPSSRLLMREVRRFCYQMGTASIGTIIYFDLHKQKTPGLFSFSQSQAIKLIYGSLSNRTHIRRHTSNSVAGESSPHQL